MSPTVEKVRDHYDHFPYPTVESLSQPKPAGFKLGALDFLLRRRSEDSLPADGAVWIAGCGTQQAAHWALCLPRATILATDVSERTLGIARGLCRELGVENVRFATHDLMEPLGEGPFDLVVGTGVVHHLPDPGAGLRYLRDALAQNGAMVLMVYSRMHRKPLAVLRRAVRTLAGPDAGPDERYDLALRLLEQELGSPTCSPPCPGALELLRERREDRAFVADCLLHPLEHTYDVDGLLALLADAGLRHGSWLNPSKWMLAPYVGDDDLLARFEGLPEVERWRTVYDVAGYGSPLLELAAEPVEAPVRPPYGLDDLLAMPLALRRSREVVRVDLGRVVARGEESSFVEEEGKLLGRGPGPFGATDRWSLPAHVRPLLEAFDGLRPAAEVIDRFEEEFGRRAILEMIGTLCPYDLGLLAPMF